VRFWDASALVPLLLDEPASTSVRELYDDDPHLLVWWATEVECVSAISRCEREGVLDLASSTFALDRLDALARRWDEVQAVPAVRNVARRLLRVHALRTADALQLAAALIASEGQPSSIGFVCLDRRLGDAAVREGLRITR